MSFNKKTNKYGVAPKADRTYNGIVFHSKSEMQRYCKLLQWQLAGHVRNIRRQVRYPLVVNPFSADPCPIQTKAGTPFVYVADFVYEKRTSAPMQHLREFDTWEEVIEDVKGMKGIGMFKIAVFEALTGKTVSICTKRADAKKKWGVRRVSKKT